MKMLVFNPGSEGGIQRYAYFQAKALQARGIDVTVLCDEGHESADQQGVPVRRCLVPDKPKSTAAGKLGRLMQIAWRILTNELRMAWVAVQTRPNVILLSSYTEYLSPGWVGLQLALKYLLGITYIANLHDPVRNFVAGPLWWHKLSVRLAYMPLSAVYVHQRCPANAGVPPHVRVREVPHGLFEPVPTPSDRKSIRNLWRIPEDAVLFLAFGFIRDGKNLDLLIKALPACPDAYLVVMGKVQSSRCKPVRFYTDLATNLGVESRLRVFEEYVPENLLPGYLDAADAVAVTYSSSFHSQSGVLNSVAGAAKPLLASAGESPLKDCVTRFQLGEFVQPDNQDALTAGMAKVSDLVRSLRAGTTPPSGSPSLDWAAYRRYASWDTNADIVLESLG